MRATKSEPVYRASNGKWYTKKTGMPVDVNQYGQIVTRKLDTDNPAVQHELSEVRRYVDMGQKATCPGLKAIYATGEKHHAEKMWKISGYEPFQPWEHYLRHVGLMTSRGKKKKNG